MHPCELTSDHVLDELRHQMIWNASAFPRIGNSRTMFLLLPDEIRCKRWKLTENTSPAEKREKNMMMTSIATLMPIPMIMTLYSVSQMYYPSAQIVCSLCASTSIRWILLFIWSRIHDSLLHAVPVVGLLAVTLIPHFSTNRETLWVNLKIISLVFIFGCHSVDDVNKTNVLHSFAERRNMWCLLCAAFAQCFYIAMRPVVR